MRPRVLKGQAKHPVPCILLARLAVDKSRQGQGVGSALFRDALLRALNAHETNRRARLFSSRH